jgi:hypothetical protein
MAFCIGWIGFSLLLITDHYAVSPIPARSFPLLLVVAHPLDHRIGRRSMLAGLVALALRQMQPRPFQMAVTVVTSLIQAVSSHLRKFSIEV